MNKVIAYTMLAAFGGSLIPPLAKLGLEVFGPFALLVFRFALVVAFLYFLVPATKRGLATSKKLLVVSIYGAVNPILLFIALQFTEANVAPIIYGAIPIMSAAYLFATRGERLNRVQDIGLMIGFLGVILVGALPLFKEQQDFRGFWANILILIAGYSAMVFVVKSRDMIVSKQSDPISVVYHFSLFTLLVSLPIAAYEQFIQGANTWSEVEVKHIAAALGVGVAMLIAYLPQQFVLKRVSATVANMTSYLQPVMGIVLAAIIVGEEITLAIAASALIILFGAWLVQRNH